jgi:hypothetical protein
MPLWFTTHRQGVLEMLTYLSSVAGRIDRPDKGPVNKAANPGEGSGATVDHTKEQLAANHFCNLYSSDAR